MYDTIIIGGGPAGVAAGVYAARKKMKCALVAQEIGGQSIVSADVQNWIGTVSVSGFDFSKMLGDHLRAQQGIDLMEGERAARIEARGDKTFLVVLESGTSLETKTILLAIGSRRRRLGVPGEKEFEGRGVVYCSTCDAPIFQNKDVAVVGGGNSGLEAVLDLLPYASHIYLLHRGEALKGDSSTQEKIRAHKNVTILLNAEPKRIEGEGGMVKTFVYEDKAAHGEKTLAVKGVFVEIGVEPNSDIVKDLVALDERRAVVTDPKTQRTSLEGIWAAGDVTDGFYRQNNISAGDAVKAILNIHDYVSRGSR